MWVDFLCYHLLLNAKPFFIFSSWYLQTFSPFAIITHSIFVTFSLTTIGMFFDRHPAAPYMEFARCSFVFFFSLNDIPLLTNALNWSGLAHTYGSDLEFYLHLVVRIYFLIAATTWGLISGYRKYGFSMHLKIKSNWFPSVLPLF